MCLFVCPLKTREWVGRLSPNFEGSSRAPLGWFVDTKRWGSWVGGQKIYTFGDEEG